MGGKVSVSTKGLTQSEDNYSDYSNDLPRWVSLKNETRPIYYAKKGIAARPEDGGCPTCTVVDIFKAAAKKWPDAPALRIERPCPSLTAKNEAPLSKDLEEWKTWSYSEFHKDVRRTSKAFMIFGVVRHDVVTVFGFNSPEWLISQLATMYLGGISAGIYPSDTPEQIIHKSNLSDAVIAVVDSEESFNIYVDIVDDIPTLKVIVAWGADAVKDIVRKDGSVVKGITWDALLAVGESDGSDADLDAACELTKPEDCSSLVFTSGTTGNSKAAMMSHDSMVFETYSIVIKGVPRLGATSEPERLLSYLPLSHVAGMMADTIAPLVCTAYRNTFLTVYFARRYDLKAGTFGDRLKAVRPTIFFGVPRVWEKIEEKVKLIGARTKGFKLMVVRWAKGASQYFFENMQLGGSGERPMTFGIAKFLILDKIKAALGLDQCHMMICGAAPMSRDTLAFFGSLGININEGYGMSECNAATTWSTDENHLWGSVGHEMWGAEVKVFREADEKNPDSGMIEAPKTTNFDQPPESCQGELCFRGRHVMMGYLCNPKLGEEHVADIIKKNNNAIDAKGWLHSGDKGSKGVNNMYRITGRYKEIIIGAGGENIAPVPIENSLKSRCPAIANCTMIGDKQKFNIVLITLKAVGSTGELPGSDELDGAAKIFNCKTVMDAVTNQDYIKMIDDAIKQTNLDGSVCPSRASQIQKFSILPVDFSISTQELTPSLKLKRSVVVEKHSELIEHIYSSAVTYTLYGKHTKEITKKRTSTA